MAKYALVILFTWKKGAVPVMFMAADIVANIAHGLRILCAILKLSAAGVGLEVSGQAFGKCIAVSGIMSLLTYWFLYPGVSALRIVSSLSPPNSQYLN